MNKFEVNSIRKQDESWKEYYAIRAFQYSCEMCSSRNLRPGKKCENCPVLEAHKRALREIKEGTRQAPEEFHYGASKFYNKKHNGGVHVTVVIKFD